MGADLVDMVLGCIAATAEEQVIRGLQNPEELHDAYYDQPHPEEHHEAAQVSPSHLKIFVLLI